MELVENMVVPFLVFREYFAAVIKKNTSQKEYV